MLVDSELIFIGFAFGVRARELGVYLVEDAGQDGMLRRKMLVK